MANRRLRQTRLVRDVLARAPSPTLPEGVAAAFDGRLTDKRRAPIEQVLETLVATGAARTDTESRYFVPR